MRSRGESCELPSSLMKFNLGKGQRIASRRDGSGPEPSLASDSLKEEYNARDIRFSVKGQQGKLSLVTLFETYVSYVHVSVGAVK